MSYEKWLEEVAREISKTSTRKWRVKDLDRDAWSVYYEDGYTPKEAVAADATNE